MLAVVKESPGPGFVLKDVPVPTLAPGEVLVKVESVGICGSDIPIFEGVRRVPLPLIQGHEFAGTVVRVSEGVKQFKPGDRVAPGLVVNCGNCHYCRLGLESLCDNMVEIGIDINGGFAEYVAVPAKQLHQLPPGLTFDQAASIDPIASAYHGVKMTQIRSTDVVVILGPGPIGLYALQLARAEGARKTIMVGTRQSRLQIAQELGADAVINIKEVDVLQEVLELTDGRGADVVIEATGAPASVDSALAITRKGGRVQLIGIFHEPAPVTIRNIVRKELIVKGSFCYTWEDFQECLELLAAGRVSIERIVTHVFRLDEMAVALETIKSRRGIKVLLHP